MGRVRHPAAGSGPDPTLVRFRALVGFSCSVRRPGWFGPWLGWGIKVRSDPVSVRYPGFWWTLDVRCWLRIWYGPRPWRGFSVRRDSDNRFPTLPSVGHPFLGSVSAFEPGLGVRFGLRLGTDSAFWGGFRVRPRSEVGSEPRQRPAERRPHGSGLSICAWSGLLSAGEPHYRSLRAPLPTPGFTITQDPQLGECARGTREV